MSGQIDFGKYYTHEELRGAMETLEKDYPSLCRLYSIGESLQGRDLWTMENTNTETGLAEEKPGLWIDGNTHSGEVTGSAVCIRTIHHLLSKHGSDDFVTDLLNTRSVYILPRVNPDGAEVFLTQPYHRTGGGILNPEFQDGEGHYEEDVDGDGVIVYMRVPDSAGDWKTSRIDPRLMLKRGQRTLKATAPLIKS